MGNNKMIRISYNFKWYCIRRYGKKYFIYEEDHPYHMCEVYPTPHESIPPKLVSKAKSLIKRLIDQMSVVDELYSLGQCKY